MPAVLRTVDQITGVGLRLGKEFVRELTAEARDRLKDRRKRIQHGGDLRDVSAERVGGADDHRTAALPSRGEHAPGQAVEDKVRRRDLLRLHVCAVRPFDRRVNARLLRLLGIHGLSQVIRFHQDRPAGDVVRRIVIRRSVIIYRAVQLPVRIDLGARLRLGAEEIVRLQQIPLFPSLRSFFFRFRIAAAGVPRGFFSVGFPHGIEDVVKVRAGAVDEHRVAVAGREYEYGRRGREIKAEDPGRAVVRQIGRAAFIDLPTADEDRVGRTVHFRGKLKIPRESARFQHKEIAVRIRLPAEGIRLDLIPVCVSVKDIHLQLRQRDLQHRIDIAGLQLVVQRFRRRPVGKGLVEIPAVHGDEILVPGRRGALEICRALDERPHRDIRHRLRDQHA